MMFAYKAEREGKPIKRKIINPGKRKSLKSVLNNHLVSNPNKVPSGILIMTTERKTEAIAIPNRLAIKKYLITNDS